MYALYVFLAGWYRLFTLRHAFQDNTGGEWCGWLVKLAQRTKVVIIVMHHVALVIASYSSWILAVCWIKTLLFFLIDHYLH